MINVDVIVNKCDNISKSNNYIKNEFMNVFMNEFRIRNNIVINNKDDWLRNRTSISTATEFDSTSIGKFVFILETKLIEHTNVVVWVCSKNKIFKKNINNKKFNVWQKICLI